MSVANPVIDYIDGFNRIIHLRSGVTSWNPVDDIYKEVRQLRHDNESLRQFDMFCSALPLIDKGGGKTTGRGMTLLLGTRIVPFDESATHDITGELLSDEGLSGTDLIDISGLSPSSKIKLNYIPPPATEVINSNSGSSSSGLTQADRDFIQAQNEANAGGGSCNGAISQPLDAVIVPASPETRAILMKSNKTLVYSIKQKTMIHPKDAQQETATNYSSGVRLMSFTFEYTIGDTEPEALAFLSNVTINGQLMPLVHTNYDFELRIEDATLQRVTSTANVGDFYVYFDLSGMTLTAGNHKAEIYQADKGTISNGTGTNGSVIQTGNVLVKAVLA